MLNNKQGSVIMEVLQAVKARRTIRKFRQTQLSKKDIADILESARVAPAGANLQSLKYAVVTDVQTRENMFPYIKYAGYLPNWNPTFEECPPVFLVIVNDTSIKPTEKCEVDCGAAIMSMCLTATEKQIGSCWLGAINREEIKKMLGFPDEYDIAYLLGLGYPDQTAKVVPMEDSVKYYFDSDGTVCVPKRSMDEILISEI